jgi:hypothetical protein
VCTSPEVRESSTRKPLLAVLELEAHMRLEKRQVASVGFVLECRSTLDVTN